MVKNGDNSDAGPSKRVQFRLKSKLHRFAQMRANGLFDGDLTEYFKYLIVKDRETCPNDADMWLQQIDTGIADLRKHIDMLEGQKAALQQQMIDQPKNL